MQEKTPSNQSIQAKLQEILHQTHTNKTRTSSIVGWSTPFSKIGSTYISKGSSKTWDDLTTSEIRHRENIVVIELNKAPNLTSDEHKLYECQVIMKHRAYFLRTSKWFVTTAATNKVYQHQNKKSTWSITIFKPKTTGRGREEKEKTLIRYPYLWEGEVPSDMMNNLCQQTICQWPQSLKTSTSSSN